MLRLSDTDETYSLKRLNMRSLLNHLRCTAGPRPPFTPIVAYPLWGLVLALRLVLMNLPTKRNRAYRSIANEFKAKWSISGRDP